MGFRTVKRPTPPPPASFAALTLRPPQGRSDKPVDDQTYGVLADLHQYEPSELDARLDRTDNSPPYWVKQTVSFKAAYANDRVIAHLFLPKNAQPPYQVIVVFGGSGIMSAKRVEDFGFPYEFLIRSGRAVMIPAYWGTLERGPSALGLSTNEEIDRAIKWSGILAGRSITSRPARTSIRRNWDFMPSAGAPVIRLVYWRWRLASELRHCCREASFRVNPARSIRGISLRVTGCRR